jgi:hypothetical protein
MVCSRPASAKAEAGCKTYNGEIKPRNREMASIWMKGGGSRKAVLSAVCSERPLSAQNSLTETQLAGGFVRSYDKPIRNDDAFQVAEGAFLVAGVSDSVVDDFAFST